MSQEEVTTKCSLIHFLLIGSWFLVNSIGQLFHCDPQSAWIHIEIVQLDDKSSQTVTLIVVRTKNTDNDLNLRIYGKAKRARGNRALE